MNTPVDDVERWIIAAPREDLVDLACRLYRSALRGEELDNDTVAEYVFSICPDPDFEGPAPSWMGWPAASS